MRPELGIQDERVFEDLGIIVINEAVRKRTCIDAKTDERQNCGGYFRMVCEPVIPSGGQNMSLEPAKARAWRKRSRQARLLFHLGEQLHELLLALLLA